LKTLVQNNSTRVPVIEVLHPDAFALRAIEFVVVGPFRGEYFLVDPFNGGDFLGSENFVVVLENPLEFARREPLALTLGANLNLLPIVFNSTEYGPTSGTIHNARLQGDRYA
jgi:hypothetical protein